MKNIVKIISLMLLVFITFSCGSDDSGAEVVTEFDGTYQGVVSENGFGQVGNYFMTVLNGQVVGAYNDGFETISFSGTVIEGGTVFLELDYGDGYVVSITISLADGKVSGFWTDSDSNTGTVAGSIQTSAFDGSYSGSASSDGSVIGSFSVTILNGKITGTYTENSETTAINGFVGASGAITFNIFFNDGSVTSLNGTISGTTISGTFSYSGGGSGTFSGQKN